LPSWIFQAQPGLHEVCVFPSLRVRVVRALPYPGTAAGPAAGRASHSCVWGACWCRAFSCSARSIFGGPLRRGALSAQSRYFFCGRILRYRQSCSVGGPALGGVQLYVYPHVLRIRAFRVVMSRCLEAGGLCCCALVLLSRVSSGCVHLRGLTFGSATMCRVLIDTPNRFR
jgi:hypothetical protein